MTGDSVEESDVQLEGGWTCSILLDGEVVGRIEGEQGKLRGISIVEKHQRKGIGSIAVEKWVRRHEAGSVIETGPVLSERSELFWRSLGFEPKNPDENIFTYKT